MAIDNKHVLVTGGAGYIGSHTAKALAAEGYTPVVLDNLFYGHEWAVQWGPLVVGDIRDKALVVETIRKFNIDSIIHFAAFAYVGESVHKPELYYSNNVLGTLALLDASLEAGIQHVIFSSTCATYGTPEAVPITESTRQSPLNPYGETKLAIERALHWYSSAHNFTYTALRYFNAAGADADGAIGEDHAPETHLIPLIIDAALGKGEVEIFGEDYPTPDGTCIRDYIHVADLADAHVRALRYLKAGGASAAMNLGTGRGYSVREVIRMVEDVAQRPVPHSIAPRRAGDPAELISSPERAHALLGWKAQHSSLENIIKSAWKWHTRPSTAQHETKQ